MKKTILLALVLTAGILTACGGGGGGGGSASAPSTDTPSPTVLPPVPEFSLGSTEAVANVAGQVSRAAQATPRAGSATQSSGANDAINVAVRAHSTESITAVIGGATLSAAHRPDVNNVRAWLTNNDVNGKLATLGISLNPTCSFGYGVTITHSGGGLHTSTCRRYARSPLLSAERHVDGGFAVIATTGQMPVVIDGRTVAINYRTATITSSQFRNANMFSRTDDGGLLYARVYSDAVLSPSTPRTVAFYEIGDALTIRNEDGTLYLLNGTLPYSSSSPSLTIVLAGNPVAGTIITPPAPGGTVNVPLIFQAERIVSTTLTGPGSSDNYLSGGFWMHAPANAESIADYEFGVFSGGSDELSAPMIPMLTGVAVYRGEAAGVYASSRQGQEEVLSFRANAVLTADFDSATNDARVSGRVDGFVLANGDTSRGEAIDLGAAERENTNTGLFSGDTSGEGFSGKWGGNFYGAPGNGEVSQPDAIAATFGGTSNDRLRSIAGFIGARRISIAMVNASFVPYTAPPLHLDAGDVWGWRDSSFDDERFFAVHDGGGKLRTAGMRYGRLEFRHRQHSAPSALAFGDDGMLPFFAASGGDMRTMEMRLRFGAGFFGFASSGDNYRQGGVMFSRDFGRFGLRSSFSRIDEDNTLLGGRWGGSIAPLTGGGESLQVRARMSFDVNDRWMLFAAAERAQTKTIDGGGGIIGRITGLRAFGWQAGAAAKNVFRYGDRLRFGLARDTSIIGGAAFLHLRQISPDGWRMVERAASMVADKHHTLSIGYGFASSPKTKWSIAAAHRTDGKNGNNNNQTRAHLQWQMKL